MTANNSASPWKAECFKGEWSVYDANGEIICSIADWDENLDRYDALLIAAAPDLLEALKELLIRAEDGIGMLYAFELAHAAIDKAEGRI